MRITVEDNERPLEIMGNAAGVAPVLADLMAAAEATNSSAAVHLETAEIEF